MRSLAPIIVVFACCTAWAAPARAQVSDAERAAARDLFKQGDELQRAGKFTEALDKFQRAQQVYAAPTNVLRVAECQAALGQLVESAESYRAVAHTQLAPGSPQAFQAAVDQAKAELAQVEPRVPKLVVQLTPGAAANPQMQIDGQSVSAALIGEPIPLDPGTHRVRVSAAGFVASEQDATLKEHETTTVTASLRPAPAPLPPPVASQRPPAAPAPAAPQRPAPAVALSAAPPPPPPAPPPALAGPPPYGGSAAAGEMGGVGAPPPYAVPPPPPPLGERQVAVGPRPSRTGLLLGAHLGWELAAGKLPLADATTADTATVATGGLAYALDGGLRFARQWYVGLTLEHAGFSHGDLSNTGATDASSQTTLLAATIAFIGNPDRPSFYGEIGAGSRWFTLSETAGATTTTSYNAGELTLGVGVWIPAGRSFRLLPKATIGLGAFSDPSGGTASEGHSFAMLGLAGFYNLDL